MNWKKKLNASDVNARVHVSVQRWTFLAHVYTWECVNVDKKNSANFAKRQFSDEHFARGKDNSAMSICFQARWYYLHVNLLMNLFPKWQFINKLDHIGKVNSSFVCPITLKCDLNHCLGVKLQLTKFRTIQWWMFLPSKVTILWQLTSTQKLIFRGRIQKLVCFGD